jgi:hypothetical protein
MVSFKKGEIMKSFNEWLKEKTEIQSEASDSLWNHWRPRAWLDGRVPSGWQKKIDQSRSNSQEDDLQDEPKHSQQNHQQNQRQNNYGSVAQIYGELGKYEKLRYEELKKRESLLTGPRKGRGLLPHETKTDYDYEIEQLRDKIKRLTGR